MRGSGSKTISRGGRRIQKNGITRKIYGKAAVWVG